MASEIKVDPKDIVDFDISLVDTQVFFLVF